MKKIFFITIYSFVLIFFSQGQTLLKPGDIAPGFVLTVKENVSQSFSMPYLNRIVLLHFWSAAAQQSRTKNSALNLLAARYKSAIYKAAENFEVITIAVQNDKKSWSEFIKSDSLNNCTNTLAQKGYEDDVCKKYGISSLPTDILVDERGIIIAVNPKLKLIENLLDERKNFLPIKKDVFGTIAYATNKTELLKLGKLYLFDSYNDSIATTMTDDKGAFKFYDIKLNQDLIIKIDNQIDIISSDPLALYNLKGELIVDSKTMNGGFIFHVPSKMVHKLSDETVSESSGEPIDEISVIKKLQFIDNKILTSKDEKELSAILLLLQKNKELTLTIITHSNTKFDAKIAMDNTIAQAMAIKDFLIKKGLTDSKIKIIPMGKNKPRKICDTIKDCSEIDHKKNQRVEFLLYKN